MGNVKTGIYCYLIADTLIHKILRFPENLKKSRLQKKILEYAGYHTLYTEHNPYLGELFQNHSFSPETEFTPLILASKSEFS